MDPHLNLFYSYSQGSTGDVYEEKILEDNTTRALVATLNILKDANVILVNSFLKQVVGLDVDAQRAMFDLQSMDDDDNLDRVHAARKKVLLCITPHGINPFLNGSFDIPYEILEWIESLYEGADEDNSEKVETLNNLRSMIQHTLVKKKGNKGNTNSLPAENNISELEKKLTELPGFPRTHCNANWLSKESFQDLAGLVLVTRPRPDGWIWDNIELPEFAVLIENKIHGETYRGQLRRHITRWEGFNEKDFNSVEKVYVRWKDIYTFFKESIVNFSDNVTNLVVKNLITFLEENNMGDFPGFIESDFKLEDRSKSWQKMELLGEYLIENLKNNGVIDKFNPAPEEGKLFVQQRVKNELKVYLGRGDIGKYCKYGFYFNRKGLRIDVAFPSLKDVHRKLVDTILANKSEFLAILNKQRYAYEFSIYNKYSFLNPTLNYAPNYIQNFYKYCTFKTRYNEQEYWTIEYGYKFEGKSSNLNESQQLVDNWFHYVLNEVQRLNNPFITIAKDFPLRFMRDKKTLFKEVLWDVFWDLFPLYDYLNDLLDKYYKQTN